VKLIQPLTSPVYLPKCKVVLDVEVKEKCDWQNQEIKLTFATKIERKWTTTRTIVLSKEEWSFEGNDLKAVVTFELTFNDEEHNVTIDYGGSAVTVQYVKYAAMKLDSPSNATKTKENFNPLYAKPELREQIKAIFPKAIFLINPQTDWKSTLVSSSIKEDLESTVIVGLNQNLETLSKDELSALNGLIASRAKALTEANQIFKKTLQRYEGLEFNYDGEKSVIFDAAYHKNIEESRIAIHAIAERLKILKEVLTKVLDAQLELKRVTSMPPSPFVIASKEVSDKLKVFRVEVQEINARFDNYNDLSLSYEAWGKELNDTTLQLSALKENSIAMWTKLSAIEGLTDKETEKFEALQESYNNFQKTLSTSEKTKAFKEKKEGLEKAGDGFLEYKAREDRFSDAEKIEFGLTEEQKEDLEKAKGKAAFKFKKPDLSLYDKKDGIELEDIKQGQVGDCYLLSAIANLAENDSDLIQDMIEEKNNLYIVTFYQNGIPVKVEVDKKLMILKIEKINILGNKEITEEFIGTTPDDDIWVPIIEKAYAKLMAKGEFTHENVQGGNAENAMKVLLGNKVKEPKVLFLDENGNLSDAPTKNEFKTPLVFAETTETALKQIILSAIEKGYKINVSSPTTYEGNSKLTDQHTIDIGDNKYMSCKHSYALTTANETNVSLFNPHGSDGKARNRKIFDLSTKKAYEKIVSILPAEGKILPETKAAIEAILNKQKALKNESDRITGTLRVKINALRDTSIAKGFRAQEITILGSQDISYKVLKEYFKDLVITIIKK
jgi:hypothetical protein